MKDYIKIANKALSVLDKINDSLEELSVKHQIASGEITGT